MAAKNRNRYLFISIFILITIVLGVIVVHLHSNINNNVTSSLNEPISNHLDTENNRDTVIISPPQSVIVENNKIIHSPEKNDIQLEKPSVVINNNKFINDLPNQLENPFIPYLKNFIKSGNDFVYLSRFYYEKQLSYNIDSNNDNMIDTFSDPKYRPFEIANKAPMVSWNRTGRENMYFFRKGTHPSTFSELANSMNHVIQTNKQVNIKALRYHFYLTHCYFLNQAGDPSVLPVPVVLTTRLDENTGYFSSDVWPKTCSIVKLFIFIITSYFA